MLHALTIFTSAFLLFLLQPLIAKQILPWFGGTAAVWTVCLAFFQLVLLGGYLYADRLSRLPLRRQALIHTVLVLLACLMLPVMPDAAWKPVAADDPSLRILALLAATIGLPYAMLSTTGPLVQSWFALSRSVGEHRADSQPAGPRPADPRTASVYRLFALSNLASLIALLAYPFVIEPLVRVRTQAWAWSAGFVLYAVLVIAVAWRTVRAVEAAQPVRDARAGTPEGEVASDPNATTPSAAPPTWADQTLWLLLAALGTVMLLTVTTHVTQDVASVPFLWIVPLALYLLSFILCFDSDFWYRRWFWWPAVIVLAPAMAWFLRAGNGVLPIMKALPLFCGGLFAICMFCHGELVRARPAPQWLTRFYLMISLGGAVGGLSVGLLAPRVFSGAWELPLALMACGLLLWRVARAHLAAPMVLLCAVFVGGLIAVAQGRLRLSLGETLVLAGGLTALLVVLMAVLRRSVRAVAPLLAGLSFVFCGWFAWNYHDFIGRDTARMERNFYGVLRVREYGTPGAEDHLRLLVHGIISHGEQYPHPSLRGKATSYYGESSGVGLAIEQLAALRGRPLRIGVIGLGVGTLAAYGQPGWTIRYYEINPAVLDIAQQQFSYLRDTRARVDTVLGDARLMLEQEAARGERQAFDLLVIDAFSSDSIPVHLLTREALATYQRHLQPDGVMAFHISNRYLDLGPVVAQLAQDAGLQATLVEDHPDRETHYWQKTTDYVLVTRDPALLQSAAWRERGSAIEPRAGLSTWTDDYNDLWGVLRR
jgi:hypothetical protein